MAWESWYVQKTPGDVPEKTHFVPKKTRLTKRAPLFVPKKPPFCTNPPPDFYQQKPPRDIKIYQKNPFLPKKNPSHQKKPIPYQKSQTFRLPCKTPNQKNQTLTTMRNPQRRLLPKKNPFFPKKKPKPCQKTPKPKKKNPFFTRKTPFFLRNRTPLFTKKTHNPQFLTQKPLKHEKKCFCTTQMFERPCHTPRPYVIAPQTQSIETRKERPHGSKRLTNCCCMDIGICTPVHPLFSKQ